MENRSTTRKFKEVYVTPFLEMVNYLSIYSKKHSDEISTGFRFYTLITMTLITISIERYDYYYELFIIIIIICTLTYLFSHNILIISFSYRYIIVSLIIIAIFPIYLSFIEMNSIKEIKYTYNYEHNYVIYSILFLYLFLVNFVVHACLVIKHSISQRKATPISKSS